MSRLTITRDDGLGPDALSLIEQSEAELASIYPPEVRYAFSPVELRDAGVLFLVGYANGIPTACGGLALLDGYGELKRIFVRSAARGQGYADAIVAALEVEGREAGIACIRLETGHDSPAAIRLYSRLGYRKIGPFGQYEENGSSVFMEKTL